MELKALSSFSISTRVIVTIIIIIIIIISSSSSSSSILNEIKWKLDLCIEHLRKAFLISLMRVAEDM